MLDDRAKLLLKALVERYIEEGQPVGSRTLSRSSGLELSPATIRNVMADLEELGLIASPHTSAGRIPTARGYRLFVDTMLTVQREKIISPALAPEQPQKVIANAAHMLSSLSQFVGVVMAPRRSSVFRHIEFVGLSDRRFLVIIVSPDGDVQNRVIFTETELYANTIAGNGQFPELPLCRDGDGKGSGKNQDRSGVASRRDCGVDDGGSQCELRSAHRKPRRRGGHCRANGTCCQ